MSNPTIRVQLEVNWDAGTDSIDDDRQIRVEVEYPNDSAAMLPDAVATKLAAFLGSLSLPLNTGPQPSAKVPRMSNADGSPTAEFAAEMRGASPAEAADAIRLQQAQKGSVSRSGQ